MYRALENLSGSCGDKTYASPSVGWRRQTAKKQQLAGLEESIDGEWVPGEHRRRLSGRFGVQHWQPIALTSESAERSGSREQHKRSMGGG